jgi:4-hydroxybenzoate polyprenyltransferase
MLNSAKLTAYVHLMRAHKPIGTLLLLWPTLMALWIANQGMPTLDLLLIFILGTFLTRSAGCVINDYFDRHVDGHVERTQDRPLASGAASPKEALVLCLSLFLLAFLLVLLTNALTIKLSFFAVAIAMIYPLMKRITHLPQLVLGVAFSFGIPMAFAASQNQVPSVAWALLAANLLWTVVYDTFYAMVDRNDDLKIGVKSTAILFGRHDRSITAILQLLCLCLLIVAGLQLTMSSPYFIAIGLSTVLFVYQQYLVRERERNACFKAFLNNNYVGLLWFAGTVLSFL